MSDPTDAVHRIEVVAPEPGPSPGYEVRIGCGLLDRAGAMIAQAIDTTAFAVISDSRVAPLYGERVLEGLRASDRTAHLFEFAAGEWNKTREVWIRLTDRMLRSGFGRDSAVVALGGGVVGDLAGFVAATYMRGVPVVQIPTTLLAMVDSAIGGKTGVDTPVGKNLVGAFHQPSLVLIDPMVLSSVSAPDLSSGLAEVLKHGLILDAEYFDDVDREMPKLLDRVPDALTGVVERSVRLKAGVVGEDVRERGYRQVLNFGHTIGHALEAVSGYELRHGEAVAIGLVAESAIGEWLGITNRGVTDRVRGVLEKARLPVELDSTLDPGRFFSAMALDKKNRGGELRYTLIAEIGRIARTHEGGWTHEISGELVREVLFGEAAPRPRSAS